MKILGPASLAALLVSGVIGLLGALFVPMGDMGAGGIIAGLVVMIISFPVVLTIIYGIVSVADLTKNKPKAIIENGEKKPEGQDIKNGSEEK